ncbi:LysE family transporter [Pseudomonas sp.]|uniref:LysE family transporter n=1 Tax=Pseudomonas sp. TaxID=306 RepID=UPI003C376BCC
MALDTWLAFFVASWIISLSPGAGAIASMSSGLQYGFLRGYWNAIGLQLGLAMQIAVVAGGLGAILAASSTAFYAIKWFGVAYLVYLAVKQWRALPLDMADDASVRPIGKPMAMMFRGFLVNASNPKALVFMLAVLPQFVNPQAPLVSQYLIIGVTMISVDMIVMAGYTGLASKVLRLLRTPKQQKRMNRTFAGLFVGAAGFLASLHRATA